jgi:hypothetical protein
MSALVSFLLLSAVCLVAFGWVGGVGLVRVAAVAAAGGCAVGAQERGRVGAVLAGG